MAETLDSALKERLHAVLDSQPLTEADLRKLSEQGQACLLIMSGQLKQREQRLAELVSDQTSSLAEVAAALRDLKQLRPELHELRALLAQLETRAREVRAPWLLTPSTTRTQPAPDPQYAAG